MSMDLSRKPNETYLDYHKRIIYGKLVDKTLGDLDYSELSDYAYGQHYSSDVARRMFYGSRRTLDLVAASQREMNANKGTMDELDEKINEFKREKQKFFDQRREYNKLQAEAGRREHLYEHLSSAAESLSKTVGDIFEPKTNINTFADNEAVIVLSDWHSDAGGQRLGSQQHTRSEFSFQNIPGSEDQDEGVAKMKDQKRQRAGQ